MVDFIVIFTMMDLVLYIVSQNKKDGHPIKAIFHTIDLRLELIIMSFNHSLLIKYKEI